MKFIRTTHEPCAIYRCCGEEFEVDPSTEENLHFNGKQLIPICPKCKQTHRPLWVGIIALPVICFLVSLHLLVCILLAICVHPEQKRYKCYEYYAPWGWGKRNI
jgi:hypothetical protein